MKTPYIFIENMQMFPEKMNANIKHIYILILPWTRMKSEFYKKMKLQNLYLKYK